MRQAEGRHKKSLDVILLLHLNETECDRSEDDFYLGVPLRVGLSLQVLARTSLRAFRCYPSRRQPLKIKLFAVVI